ncbi:MAG: type I glyceraldehyde-3-phosphate dehydrogenase [bacterium]|nr:type I glyceraldehyde-3-phosphate dehydrogenase [bacterium]
MKKIRVGINGFGRIGRAFFRQAFGHNEIDIVAVNDLGDVDNLAYLLKYDTAYNRYQRPVTSNQGKLMIDGQEVRFLQVKDPATLPWKDLAVDVVVESTGIFEDYDKASAHIRAGAKRVVISAPGKGAEGDKGVTVLMGLNDDRLPKFTVTSNASCTTNATSPVVAVMSENPGILKAVLSTVHGYTATQKLVDSPDAKDWRRGRAAAQNIIPSTTGAAISVTKALPALAGKFDGIAIRVPVLTGSLVDLTFLAARKTSVEEINEIFCKAAKEPRWQGLLEASDEELVSSDIVGATTASIVDLAFTKVIDGDLVKVLAWYDNEWGYTATLLRHVLSAGALQQ